MMKHSNLNSLTKIMKEMKINKILFLIGLMLLCLNDSAHSIEKNYLEPNKSLFYNLEIINKYHNSVRKILLPSWDGLYYVNMVVLPSFEPEWSIIIKQPEGDVSEVIYRIPTEQIWGYKNPKYIKSKEFKAEIPKELAEDIKAVWFMMLSEVRYTKKNGFGLDGIMYYFSAFEQEDYRGPLNGQVYSPSDDTTTGQLTHIGYLLRDYVLAKEKDSTIIFKKINKSIELIKDAYLVNEKGNPDIKINE